MRERVFTLSKFYADADRANSEERRFGARWAEPGGGECQVGWICDTGELFVARPQTDSGSGEVFGNVVLDVLGAVVYEGIRSVVTHRHPVPEVEVIAVVQDEAELTELMSGWEDHEATPSGLDWLRERVASARGARS